VIQTLQTASESPAQRLAFAEAVPAVSARGRDRLSAAASLVALEQGIYTLTIGETASSSDDEYSGVRVPLIQVAAPPGPDGRCAEIIGNGQHETWLGREGGMIILRSPPGGAQILVTVYVPPAQPLALPHIEMRRLDRPRSNGAAPGPGEPATEPEEIRTEIVLHIERMGDQRFAGQNWAGNCGKRLRVEAFSIRPLEALAARDIEFMALGPKRRQTPWVSDAKLCGTRGQGMPLTGFAIRLAPHARDRFDIVYEGSFFESGIVGPHRNGELCIPQVGDDPLEAIKVRLTRHPVGRGRGPG
jgi:hypothetical protein